MFRHSVYMKPRPVAFVQLGEVRNEYMLKQLDRSTVRVNGLAPSSFTLGDADLDGQPDLLLDLDPLALIDTLAGGSSAFTVTTSKSRPR